MIESEWREAMFRLHHARGDFPHHMHFIGRGGGRSRGGPGGMFSAEGGRGAGRPSFVRGRKFGAEELQLLLLSLLKQQPSYGYELIKLLAERSGGFYTPSPGVIYPAMSYMEDVGYVSVQPEGSRKRYAISSEGERWLEENRPAAEALLAKLEMFARQSESFNQAMREQRQVFTPQLMDALHALRGEMHNWHQSSDEAQKQAAKILTEALQQLRALKDKS
ncbi:hypothetical protein BTJ39_08395 [Izhakiella australiensis]|uniref:Transcription regulator PadR N-terminal domain-containing protein n=2 Tax=Izhakiella australiensis TaxID=1926881 RepID=A0A1S8YNX6_9GAMM|nr:hypothetical protein BTJ39_08395 [Izhakiella australiensis]